jgi:hypothetical protein
LQIPSVDNDEVYAVAETLPHEKPTFAKQRLEKQNGGKQK